tara:strand:+ start:265 stop:477 length:213 start_codon:yes stop_codon:yes gene_type:complete
MILTNYLLLFTKISIFDSIKKESFFNMINEKDLSNIEGLTEKTFWELLTEENIDQDEILYGEGEIRQEDY